MRDHLIGKNDILGFCYVCGASMEGHEWKSHFHSEIHYKTTRCKQCGKEHNFSVHFQGSGHDTWVEYVKDFINQKTEQQKKN